MFSITRPCTRCGGSGTVIEEPCHDVRRRGPPARGQEVPGEHPRGRQGRLAIKLAGKGEAGLRGGKPGDLYVITHVNESPVFSRKGDNLEVEVPITVAEALQGGDIEVPTLNGTKRLRSRRAPRAARSSACAARARRSSAARAAATSTTAS